MERSIDTGSMITAGKTYRKSYTAFLLTACFLLPAVIMLVTYAGYGMAPFGENSVLIMDMSNQYCEFYCGLKHIGKMGDLFFSSDILAGVEESVRNAVKDNFAKVGGSGIVKRDRKSVV